MKKSIKQTLFVFGIVGIFTLVYSYGPSFNQISERVSEEVSEFTKTDAELEKRASVGGAEEQYAVGLLYWQGKDIANNDAKAYQYFKQSSSQVHLKAQYMLGVLHFLGRGVEQDLDKVNVLWEKVASQGYDKAQYNLGLMLINRDGRRVKTDLYQGKKWLQKAANQGYEKAQVVLDNLEKKYH